MSNLQYSSILLGGVQKKFITSLEKQNRWAIKSVFFRTKFQRSSDTKLKHSIFTVRNFVDINMTNNLLKGKKNELPAASDNPIFYQMFFIRKSPKSNLLYFNFFVVSKFRKVSDFKHMVWCLFGTRYPRI